MNFIETNDGYLVPESRVRRIELVTDGKLRRVHRLIDTDDGSYPVSVPKTIDEIVPNYNPKVQWVTVYAAEDGEVGIRVYPIVAWRVEGFYDSDKPVGEPITIETLCSNERGGILLEDGRVVLQDEQEFNSVEAFADHVVSKLTRDKVAAEAPAI